MISDYEISLAIPDDVPGMVALQEVNLPDSGGSLSVRLTVDWFKDAILEKAVVVCRYDGKVVGYLMGTSLAANAHVALIQAMLCAFPPPPDCYLYGPICVAESERGNGHARALFEELRHAFLDALPCFSCGQTTQPRSERTRKWGCMTSAHL